MTLVLHPDVIAFASVVPEVADALSTHSAREAALKQLQRDKPSRNDRANAMRRDQEAGADAIEAGEPMPKTGKHLAAHERAVADHERAMGAAQVALARIETRVMALVEEHKSEWVARAEADYADAIDACREAIDALSLTTAQLGRALAIKRYIRTFPRDRYSGAINFSLKELRQTNGGEYTLSLCSSCACVAGRPAREPAGAQAHVHLSTPRSARIANR